MERPREPARTAVAVERHRRDHGAKVRGQAAHAKQTCEAHEKPHLAGSWLFVIVGVAVLLAAGGIYWLFRSDGDGPPTVAVAAADGSPKSQQIARDLLVNLGNLQSVKSGSMTLVNGPGNSSPADLQFQVADTGNATSPSASLTLLDGTDRGLLWSGDFNQPSGSAADLKQQLAVTGGRALACALDGLSGNKRPPWQTGPEELSQRLRTTCRFGDPRPVIPALKE